MHRTVHKLITQIHLGLVPHQIRRIQCARETESIARELSVTVNPDIVGPRNIQRESRLGIHAEPRFAALRTPAKPVKSLEVIERLLLMVKKLRKYYLCPLHVTSVDSAFSAKWACWLRRRMLPRCDDPQFAALQPPAC